MYGWVYIGGWIYNPRFWDGTRVSLPWSGGSEFGVWRIGMAWHGVIHLKRTIRCVDDGSYVALRRGLNWIGLGWTGLGWTGLKWIGLRSISGTTLH